MKIPEIQQFLNNHHTKSLVTNGFHYPTYCAVSWKQYCRNMYFCKYRKKKKVYTLALFFQVIWESFIVHPDHRVKQGILNEPSIFK